MKTRFYLDNMQIEPPLNYKELEVELNFDKDEPTAQVSTNKWTFVRANAAFINKYWNDGLIGGPGYLEGLPFRIELEHKGSVKTLFDGYLDLSKDDLERSSHHITATAIEFHKTDWLNDVADSVTYDVMFAKTNFSNKFVKIPYIINRVPDSYGAFMAAVTSFVIVNELIKAINELSQFLAETANPFAAPSSIAKLVIYIVYIITLIASLITLIIQMVDMIIQPVKYHAAMRVNDLLQIGAAYFNMSYSSTIFQQQLPDLVILPEKYISNESRAGVYGFLTPNEPDMLGYYKQTFGELLRTIKLIFNAKIVIKNSTLIIERKDYNTSAKLYQLPDLRNDYIGSNAADFKRGHYIKFATDINDKNTIDQYTGSAYQITLNPKIVKNPKLLLWRGIETIGIPFSRGLNKKKLTTPEVIIKGLLDGFGIFINTLITVANAIIAVIQSLVDLINDIVDALAVIGIDLNFNLQAPQQIAYVTPGALIEDRLGMLMLENDFVDVPKIFNIKEGNIPRKTDVLETFTAKFVWENYYSINSWMPINGKHGQYNKRSIGNVPFCFEDFEKVNDDNIFLDNFGKTALLGKARWNVYKQNADLTYSVNELAIDNFAAPTITEGNGN